MVPPNNIGPTACRRYSNEVTTPKLPPPPRSAQNRSGFSVALVRARRPSAVTTSTAVRLSHERPYLRPMRPTPPPSVSPATPVSAAVPAVVASPKACASRSNSPSSTPDSTRARPARGSTRTLRMDDTSTTRPPSQPDCPDRLWPPPRTAVSRPCAATPAAQKVLLFTFSPHQCHASVLRPRPGRQAQVAHALRLPGLWHTGAPRAGETDRWLIAS